MNEEGKPISHDGVSLMVVKTEFLNDGVMNRRMGRTGAERRKRLQKELADRKKSFEFRDRKVAEALAKEKEKKAKAKLQQRSAQSDGTKAPLQAGDQSSLVSTVPNGLSKQPDEKENQLPRSNTGHQTTETLDVGVSPDSWIKQLNDNAAVA